MTRSPDTETEPAQPIAAPQGASTVADRQVTATLGASLVAVQRAAGNQAARLLLRGAGGADRPEPGLAPAQVVALQRRAGNRTARAVLARQQAPATVAADDAAETTNRGGRWQRILFTPRSTMDAQEFRIQSTMQFYGVDRQTAAGIADRATVSGPHNTGGVEAEEVGKPIVVAFRLDSAEGTGSGGEGGARDDAAAISAGRAEFSKMSAAERTSITQETNRRFWRWTGLPSGTKIGMSKEEEAARRLWMQVRDQVIRESGELAALDPHVGSFVSPEGRPIDPKDYQAALRVAHKLERFSDEDWALYLRRVNASTEDFYALEVSIDRFLDRQAREHEVRDRIAGQESVYKLVRDFRADEERAFTSYGDSPPPIVSPLVQRELAKSEAKAAAAVKAAGYKDIRDFEAACFAYLNLFRTRAVEIALLALAASEKVVRAELARYQKAAENEDLVKKLRPLQQFYREAIQADLRGMPKTHAARGVAWTEPRTPAQKVAQAEAREKFKSAEAQRTSLAESHPILKDPELKTWKLARARDIGELGELLRGEAEDRLADITRTRAKLTEDPNTVFKLDRVVALTRQELGATDNTIGAAIVADHVEEIASRQMFIGFMVAALAIGLGLLTFGGGTVAVLGAAGALGLGVYQVGDEWERYQEAMAAAHSAFDPSQSVSSQEGSPVWVALAVVGVIFDAVALKNVLRAAAPAARVFEETGSAARFAETLAEAEGLSNTLKGRLVAAARAEEEYRAATRQLGEALRESLGRAYSGGLDPDVIVAATKAAYAAAKKGIRKFEVWLADMRLQKLLKGVDLDKLTPEQLAQLRQAFESGVQQQSMGIGKAAGATAAKAAPPKVTVRGRLTPDPRTAGTGGISSIHYNLTPGNRVEVVIQGRLGSPIAERAANAPNFNREGIWGDLRRAHNLPDWEAAHLWGPGFGDEAAAGIMLAPKEVNQVWQNRGVEKLIRELRELAGKEGAEVHLRAVATSQKRTLGGGAGDSFLSHVQYEFRITKPGRQPTTAAHVSFSVGPPPGGKVYDVEVDSLLAGATR